jgi:hypothetical protein
MKERKKPPYRDSLWRANEFVARPIPEREWLIEPVIPHPGLGLLYSWRGSGKTFTAMSMAIAVARGEAWMGYQTPRARATLYVDGEMPLGDLRSRLDGLTREGGPPDNLYILASEDLAVAHRNINLANAPDRDELAGMLAGLPDVQFIVLDNWTSLVRGIDENDNSKMDPIKEWLVTLRHGERSVLIVHHAGKSGGQRGGSAREDVIDWSACLTRRNTSGSKESYFNFQWDKMRTGMPEDTQFVIRLHREDDKRYVLKRVAGSISGGNGKLDSEIIALLKDQGPMKLSAIAEALGADGRGLHWTLDRLEKKGRIVRYPNGEFGCSA